MRKSKKAIAMLLVLSMLTGCLYGCSENKAEKNQLTYEIEKQNVKDKIAETDIDFVKDGKSEFVIVVPDEVTDNEKFAANEMQYFVKGATGIELPIVKEKKASNNKKCIYIGETKAAKKAGVEPKYEEVKYNGFVIKQIDENVYLKGYSDVGTRNSVYEFLEYAFDYECYAADEIRLTETKNAKMLAYDIMVNPSIDWREGNYGEIVYNHTLGYRMRFNNTEEIFVTGHLTHNSMKIIDPTKYDWTSDKYKDWFSNSTWKGFLADGTECPTQLCYSNDKMCEEYTKNLIELIKTANAPNMLMGMEDNLEWCTCDKCTKSKEKYGTDSAVIVKFVNKVQKGVDEWFAKNRPGEEPTHLVVFAYYSTVNPPATYDAKTQTYTPIDDSVILNERSGIMFAPITAEYDIPFEDSKVDDINGPNGQVTGWTSITKNIYAWTYSLFPSSGLLFFDSVETMQQNYSFLANNGCQMLLDQTDMYQQNINSGFSRVKAYVMSKLQWDTSLNLNELLDDFFVNYFDVASETMQSLFNQEREWLTYIYKNTEATGRISDYLVEDKYWSFNQLESYMDMIDKAFKDIEPLRETDMARYSKLYNRILLEGMQFRYIILSVYGTEFTEDELLEQRKEFKYDFEKLGLTTYGENKDINDLWNDWGIN